MPEQGEVVNVDAVVKFVLPGTWFAFDMVDPERRRAGIARVVLRQFGRSDEYARSRREMAERLEKSANDAIALGAIYFALALELYPGVPLAASLMLIDEGALTPTSSREEAELIERFDALTSGAEQVEGNLGVLRRTITSTEAKLDPASQESTPSLQISYWFRRERREPSRFLISVPGDVPRDETVQFFDVIARSATWQDG